MELITILNSCYHFPGFVYQQARFSADRKSIEVSVRPRKGSAASTVAARAPWWWTKSPGVTANAP
jgi:hypothetical protein